MSWNLIIGITLVVVVLAIIGGYFYLKNPDCPVYGCKPSDLKPFKDLVYGINPKYLHAVKNAYNSYFLTAINRANKLTLQKIDVNNVQLVMNDILSNPEMTEVKKQTEMNLPSDNIDKMKRYFIKATISQLLDNYYTGPNINYKSLVLPVVGVVPIEYTSKKASNTIKPSQLYPFLIIAPNIPKANLVEISDLYDTLVAKYMGLLNKAVAGLTEVNETTFNIKSFMTASMPEVLDDFATIQEKISIKDILPSFARKVVYANVVPFLDVFYRGPPIDIKKIIDSPFYTLKMRFHYPNSDRKSIFTIITMPTLVCPPVSGTYKGPDGLCRCLPGFGLDANNVCKPYCAVGTRFIGFAGPQLVTCQPNDYRLPVVVVPILKGKILDPDTDTEVDINPYSDPIAVAAAAAAADVANKKEAEAKAAAAKARADAKAAAAAKLAATPPTPPTPPTSATATTTSTSSAK